MKKLLLLLVAFVLTLTLAGCGGSDLAELPEEVTMDNVDEYLGRPDVQYVDLRDFDEKLRSGYISGFESIPFFAYLEATEILVRQDGDWNYDSADLLSQAALTDLFDADKVIFLMCGSGTRAGYVQAALESLDYTVYNVGGFTDYAGDFGVTGDGSFTLDLDTQVEGDWTPGTYFGYDNVGDYMVTVVINENGGIGAVLFDAVYGNSTKQEMGDAYMLASQTSWKTEADELAAYIIENQGWGDITLSETTYDSTWTALTVPHHLIYIDQDNSPEGVAGVTIGAEGFVFAWNDAIAQASDSDLGVVTTTTTASQWAAAHELAFTYTDGVYFGLDEETGYSVKVTVSGGEITEVFFDALYEVFDECLVDGVADTTITRASNCEPADAQDTSTYEVVSHWSTKQVLGEDYGMRTDAGLTWAEMAELLSDAILDAQQWDPLWVINVSTTGGHDYFDLDEADDPDTTDVDESYTGDAYTVDAVAGVTAGIDGFKAAWDEAIAQATPAS